jgi:hypothetical protein
MELSASPESKEKPARPSRRRGCLLTALIAPMLLLPGFYWFENWSGRRALEKIKAQYESAGLSLDPAAFVPDGGRAEDNFGATPLLDGIMHPADDSPGGKAAEAKREAFKKLLPHRASSTHPVGKSTAALISHELPDVTGDAPEWAKVRAYLEAHTPCKPPPDGPSDARAVFQALEVHRAVLDELIAAATRPNAFFTPSPRERFLAIRQGAEVSYNASSIMPLMRLLSLRAHAAAASGQPAEITPLARVLWKMRAAAMNESMAIGHLIGATLEGMWATSAKALLRTSGVTDAQLAEMAAVIPEDWSPERELEFSWRGETALSVELLTSLKNKGVDAGTQLHSKGQERMIRFGPSGWIDQNAVTLLQRRRDFFFLPFRSGGFKGLPASEAPDRPAAASWLEEWSPHRFLQNSMIEGALFKSIVFKHTRTRLMLLAIGMERYRMQHGRYPADASALVPESIARLPLDIDGAPLRIAVTPDGQNAVLYSIGWNLADDWHGSTTRHEAKEEQHNDDWPMALPFPPLPVP